MSGLASRNSNQRALNLRSRRSSIKTLGLLGLSGIGCKPSSGKPARLWLAGDLHLGEHLPPSSAFLKALPGSGILNLEGPIAEGPGWQKGPKERSVILRNHPATPQWLTEHRVAALSLLNNHREDLGPIIAKQTRDQLRASRHRLLTPAAQGLVALGDSWHLGAAFLGQGKSVGITDEDLKAIATASSQGQRVVLSLHVDSPPSFLPSPKIRAQVLRLADAGAAVIALHGSHVMGPIERRGESLIAWGLGNLSFACPCSTEREALILQLRTGKSRQIQARISPILAGNPQTPIKAHPDPASVFELLSALDSSPFQVRGASATL